MNFHDSGRRADLRLPLGYASAASPEGADLVILNTCHIREKAAEKVFSELGMIRRLKQARERQGGRMLVAVAGLCAQAEGGGIQPAGALFRVRVAPPTAHPLPRTVSGRLS